MNHSCDKFCAVNKFYLYGIKAGTLGDNGIFTSTGKVGYTQKRKQIKCNVKGELYYEKK